MADAVSAANELRQMVMRASPTPLHGKPAGITVGVRDGEDCPMLVVTVSRTQALPPLPSEFQGCDVVVEFTG